MQKFGIIFDWDGVIIDSSAQHEESWERLAKNRNLSLPAGHFLKGFGMKNEWIIPNILDWSKDPKTIRELSLEKEYLYREIIKEKGISALTGVDAFLEKLKGAQIPCVIGSSTHKENITTALSLLGFDKYFKHIVSAEDVKQGKPHPDVFLKGAEKLGLKPESCIVVEDALVGIQAARAGNMQVIAVTNTLSQGELKTADKIVDRLDEIELAHLEGLIGQ